MPRLIAVGAGAALVAAAGVWVLALRGEHEPAVHHATRRSARPIEDRTPVPPHTVLVRGVVRDDRQDVVGGAEVVVRGTAGDEQIAKANSAGAWSIALPPATYHVYARKDGLLAVGAGDKHKLDDEPLVRPPNVADDALIPALVVGGEPLPPIELAMIHAATVTGTVFDDRGEPLANASVRARPLERDDRAWLAPVIGSDVGHTDAKGEFALAVAPGKYQLETAHPRYTTSIAFQQFEVAPGDKREVNAFMFRGCQIEGRVVTADGKPASDGSITRRDGTGYVTTAGNHGGDGTFRLTTSDEDDVTLLAWPWGSSPSAARTFACADGAAFKDVTFRLPADQSPDAWGVLADAAGLPVPLAYIEVEPLDSGDAPHQQERTDANGAFRLFGATWGRFRMTASAPGKGIAALIVTTPAHLTDFGLGGTGRIAGTVTGIADGSFEAQFESCADNARASTSAASLQQAAQIASVLPANGAPLNGATVEPIFLAHEPRIVPVRGGRFAIDGAPACLLTLTARWHGVEKQLQVAVEAGQATPVELELGRAEDKQIYGVVRGAPGDGDDGEGPPISGARVVARTGEHVLASTTTDAEGRYTLRAAAGAALEVSSSEGRAEAEVGLANVGDEQIDFALGGH